MKIQVTADELKLVTSAMTWATCQPFYRSCVPEFTEQQKSRLDVIFDEICKERHRTDIDWSATLDKDSLIIRGRTIATGKSEIQNLRVCLDACYREIGHSPTEISVVTGLPHKLYTSLLDRVSNLDDGVEANAQHY